MIARARLIDWAVVPADVARFASAEQTRLTAGRDYPVVALSVYLGVAFLLVEDDEGQPRFCPASLFEPCTGPTPANWRCTTRLGGGVELVIGPAFVSESLEAYSDVVDQTPDAIESVTRWLRSRG